METTLILPLNSDQAELKTVGGKGANLSLLARAGFPVPDGFLVTTQAYLAFISSNHLEERIQATLPDVENGSPEDLERVSAQIRAIYCRYTNGIYLFYLNCMS